METPKSLSIFTVDEDLLNQWFDSFDPSIKTFATDFAMNKLRRYDFDFDKISDDDDKYFAKLLSIHFAAFLELKIMDACPGRIVEGWAPIPPS